MATVGRAVSYLRGLGFLEFIMIHFIRYQVSHLIPVPPQKVVRSAKCYGSSVHQVDGNRPLLVQQSKMRDKHIISCHEVKKLEKANILINTINAHGF